MTPHLQDRVAFVSGAGNGIGRATARLLAQAGATVCVNDVRQEFVDKVVGEINDDGGRAFAITQDVGDRDGMAAALGMLMAQAGRLDIHVNNAAWVRYQAVPDITPEVMDRMLAIGFKSVVWGTQLAAQHMDEQRGGAIVNIASAAGYRSPLNSVVYSGIKAGVMGITRAAAAELGPRNIRVNAIVPSAIPTEGTAKFRSAEKDARRVSRTPLSRLGTVEDIAKAVCFLASDAASFITAEELFVDGGISKTNI